MLKYLLIDFHKSLTFICWPRKSLTMNSFIKNLLFLLQLLDAFQFRIVTNVRRSKRKIFFSLRNFLFFSSETNFCQFMNRLFKFSSLFELFIWKNDPSFVRISKCSFKINNLEQQFVSFVQDFWWSRRFQDLGTSQRLNHRRLRFVQIWMERR